MSHYTKISDVIGLLNQMRGEVRVGPDGEGRAQKDFMAQAQH